MENEAGSAGRKGTGGRRRQGSAERVSDASIPAESEVRLEVTPHDAGEELVAQTTAAVLGHRLIRELLGEDELVLVGFEVLDKDIRPSSQFTTLAHDRSSARSLRVHGKLDDLEHLSVSHATHQLPPGDVEFSRAISAVLADDELSAVIESEQMQAYRPMPPLANIENPDGSVDRVVTVGLRSGTGEVRHQIVGVRARDGAIIREPIGVPARSASDCEPARPQDGCVPSEGPKQVR